jgi:hypothetical protein
MTPAEGQGGACAVPVEERAQRFIDECPLENIGTVSFTGLKAWTNWPVKRLVSDLLEALNRRSPAPTAASEPVAWRCQRSLARPDQWAHYTEKPVHPHGCCEPLYAHQQPRPAEAVYGIIDPEYARIYTIARLLAWSEGYALLMNGSFTRDLDLVAVPWADKVSEPEHFVRRLLASTEDMLRAIHREDSEPGPPSEKPHGRLTWTLCFKKFGDPRFVDLCVFVPHPPAAFGAARVVAGEDGAREKAERRLANFIACIPPKVEGYKMTDALAAKLLFALQDLVERTFKADAALKQEKDNG